MTENDKMNGAFGLWGECPEGTPVAWGARAISMNSGFDLLPDRQSWKGSQALRTAFNRSLNSGALKRANEEVKRLKCGWHPVMELSADQFFNYWYRRKRDEPELFASWSAIGDADAAPRVYSAPQNLGDTNPRRIHSSIRREISRRDQGLEEDGELYEAPLLSAYSKVAGYQKPRMSDQKGEVFTVFSDGSITIKADTRGSYGYVYLIAYPTHHTYDPEYLLPTASYHEVKDPESKEVFWSGPTPVPMPGDTVEIMRPALGAATVISHRIEHRWLHLITVPKGPFPDYWYEQRKDGLFPCAETWNVSGNEINPK